MDSSRDSYENNTQTPDVSVNNIKPNIGISKSLIKIEEESTSQNDN